MENESLVDYAATAACLICSFVPTSIGATSNNLIYISVLTTMVPILSYIGDLELNFTTAVFCTTYF